MDHSAEPDEDLRLDALAGQEARSGEMRDRMCALKIAVRARPASMHHPLRDALVAEPAKLLKCVNVLQQDATASGCRLAVLIRADTVPGFTGQKVG